MQSTSYLLLARKIMSPVLAYTRLMPAASDLFFFNDTATTEIYTLSLHDALPISSPAPPIRHLDSALRSVRHGTGLEGLQRRRPPGNVLRRVVGPGALPGVGTHRREGARDRKSTRLNSSHDQISYAVFCLKKKSARPRPNLPKTRPQILPRNPRSTSWASEANRAATGFPALAASWKARFGFTASGAGSTMLRRRVSKSSTGRPAPTLSRLSRRCAGEDFRRFSHPRLGPLTSGIRLLPTNHSIGTKP